MVCLSVNTFFLLFHSTTKNINDCLYVCGSKSRCARANPFWFKLAMCIYACGAFLGLRSATATSHIFSNNARYEDLNALSFYPQPPNIQLLICREEWIGKTSPTSFLVYTNVNKKTKQTFVILQSFCFRYSKKRWKLY